MKKYFTKPFIITVAAILIIASVGIWKAQTTHASYGWVQGAIQRGNSPQSTAFGSNVTAGNLIIVDINVESGSATVSGITDTLGNTFHYITSISYISATFENELWYATSPSGGADTVKASLTGASEETVGVNEYSGVSTLDTSNAIQGGAGGVTSIPLTTHYNNELIFSFKTAGSPVTVGSTFTQRNSTVFQYYNVDEDNNSATNTAGSNPATWQDTQSYPIALAATFYAPAASNPVTPKANITILQTGSLDIKQGGSLFIKNAN